MEHGLLQGKAPIHIAAVSERTGSLEILLQHDADVNALDGEVSSSEGCCYRVIKSAP